MAEMTGTTYRRVPNAGLEEGQFTWLASSQRKRLTWIRFENAVSAANSDTVTFSAAVGGHGGLTTVIGAHVVADDGTLGTFTLATNVVTVTNGSTKRWRGFAYGVE